MPQRTQRRSHGRSAHRAIKRGLVSFLAFSCVSLSTAEALVPRTFLSRVLAGRGGSSAAATFTQRQVLETPHDEQLVNGSRGANGKHQPPANGASANGVAAATASVPIVPATYVAETKLPTDIGQFQLRAYRTERSTTNEFMGNEPCVIYSPEKSPFGRDGSWRKDVPVRIHDQCLTSEVFGSQRCDCKEQLKLSLQYIQENGGAIIYLQQEGRGIGLANKVAAYAMQDIGLDTVDANLHLGFPDDAREYGVVPAILDDMKVQSIQLMTNNPLKVQRLRDLGIDVTDSLPVVVPSTNPYNHRYLATKQDRMDHRNLKNVLANGAMAPRRRLPQTIAENYVTAGEEMCANAVTVSLMESEVAGTASSSSDGDNDEAGVTANDDGYCFGKQSVIDAIQAIKEGKMVCVVDDMNRENEGDLIMAADACTPQDMAFIVKYSSGVVCIAMEGKRMDELKLPAMVSDNEDPKETAFSVTVDATKEHGITTGISATDRSRTVRLLAQPDCKPSDFARPGHIFPLRAQEGGVLTRDGHTEAAIDLSVLAGRSPSGILCEIVSEENPVEMMRLPEMKRFCKKYDFVLTSIVDLQQYRRETEGL